MHFYVSFFYASLPKLATVMSLKADFSNVNVNPSLTPWRGANA